MKKYFAPIIIGLFLVIYLSTMGMHIWFSSDASISLFYKLLFTLIPIGIACGAIYVTLERIKEIKGGEEDDASKY